ncbi:hypothetical protein A2881_02525 [Candidatus Peribacteria bacterium RIFCSPHIGHO2_01_FULL_55_13]|nr:MAG: hypothetical protein A2881_02525 [Candidatus Peribacteria bacterium RIFCSPHIGHO2_01_FULL_55_13]OGJ64142.1 MAG: hypothetical protein A3F36_05130 [Candidatus Peribacteria bacterium RIFCSPHIGHO2_12_FULL_55_11]
MRENQRLDLAERLNEKFSFYWENAPLEIQDRYKARCEAAIIQLDAGDHVEAINTLHACIRAIYWELRAAHTPLGS